MRLTKKEKNNEYGYVEYSSEMSKAISTKLGQYEDIDESPEHLAKIKKAFEIIKRHPFAFASLAMFLKDYNTYEEWEKINPNCFTKEEYDLLKEVL